MNAKAEITVFQAVRLALVGLGLVAAFAFHPWRQAKAASVAYNPAAVVVLQPAFRVAPSFSSIRFDGSNFLWKVPNEEPEIPEVPAPLGHPPLKVVVGSDVYSVHYTTPAWMKKHGVVAWSQSGKMEIWLTRDSEPDDLLHEVLHAALNAAGGRDKSYEASTAEWNEEDDGFIHPISPVLLEVLQDNPKLVAWLTQ